MSTTTIRNARRERARQLLDALRDGCSWTAKDLATVLLGPGSDGRSVQPVLIVLEKAGAVVRSGHVWLPKNPVPPRYKNRVFIWRGTGTPAPEPEPEPEPDPPPKLEKGITREEHEAHLRQGREIAERKAALKRARGGPNRDRAL